MKFNKFIFTFSAMTMACSMLNAQNTMNISEGAVTTSTDTGLSSEAAGAWLDQDNFNTTADEQPLTPNQVKFINFYMNFPEAPQFNNFSKAKLMRLNLLMALHKKDLNPSAMERYQVSQLLKAGIDAPAIAKLYMITGLIEDKKELNSEQVAFLKNVIIPKIDIPHSALCFHHFFNPLADYVISNPKEFSEKVINHLTEAATASVGMESKDRDILNTLAAEGSDEAKVKKPEVIALNKLEMMGALNLLVVFSPEKLVTFQEVIAANPGLFNSKKTATFNDAVSRDPRVVQFKRENPDFNPKLNAKMNQAQMRMDRKTPNAPRPQAPSPRNQAPNRPNR